MSTQGTNLTGGEQTASPVKQTYWNGEKLDWHNGLALRWAFQQGQRLKATGLGRREHLVLMSIAAHTDLEGHNQAFLGYASLVRETGFERSTISEAVQRLKNAGVLKVTEHNSGCNWYEIVPNASTWIVVQKINQSRKATSPKTGLVQNLAGGSPESGRGVVQNLAGGSPESGPEEVPVRSTGEEGSEEAPPSPVNASATLPDLETRKSPKAKTTSTERTHTLAKPYCASAGSSPVTPNPQPSPTSSSAAPQYKCSGCGNMTTLPFVPESDDPIYCRKCYRERQQQRDRKAPASTNPSSTAPSSDEAKRARMRKMFKEE